MDLLDIKLRLGVILWEVNRLFLNVYIFRTLHHSRPRTFWSAPRIATLDLQEVDRFLVLIKKSAASGDENDTIYDQSSWKTIPFGAAHSYIAHIREYPPGALKAGVSSSQVCLSLSTRTSFVRLTGSDQSLMVNWYETLKKEKKLISHQFAYVTFSQYRKVHFYS